MSLLLAFHDTDTGCTSGYITPMVLDDTNVTRIIESCLNVDCVEDEESIFLELKVINHHTIGNRTVAIVTYNANGWGFDPIEHVGSVTVYHHHSRSEAVNKWFYMGE